MEGYEQHDAPKNSEPEDGIDEIVEDQVLCLGRAGLKWLRTGFAGRSQLLCGSHGCGV